MRWWIALIAAALMLWLVGCGQVSPTTSAKSPVNTPTPPVAEPIPLLTVNTRFGPTPIVEVIIGGQTLKVLLDTGSTGLRVLASRVPPDAVQHTGPASPYGYGTGIIISGDLARANIQLGPYQSVGPIPIELVTGTTCAPQQPNCPAAGGQKPVMFGGRLDGIMGVSPLLAAGIINPLWQLPDGFGHAFAIHYDPAGQSSVLVGVPAAGYTLVHLNPTDPDGLSTPPNRSLNASEASPGWDPRISVCFTLSTLPGGKACGPTSFDTGASGLLLIQTPGGSPGAVPTGTPIGLTVPGGGLSYTYTTGPNSTGTIVAAVTSRSIIGSVVGLPLFATADVRYDLADGTIGFRPR
jgi:hypothetical protein